MCKANRTQSASTGESYDGETTRLVRSEPTCRASYSFPWWTLWLIWPLIALFKAVSASVLNGWQALGGIVVPANVLLALALITVGLVVLARSRHSEE